MGGGLPANSQRAALAVEAKWLVWGGKGRG